MRPFPIRATLFVKPDHYESPRMLYSQGVRLEELGIPAKDGTPVETDGAQDLGACSPATGISSAATPSRLWLEDSLERCFGITERLAPGNADRLYDTIDEALGKPEFRPRGPVRALQHRGDLDHRQRHRRVEVAPTDPGLRLERPRAASLSPGYLVVDPERAGFHDGVQTLLAITGQPATWQGLSFPPIASAAPFSSRWAPPLDRPRPCQRPHRRYRHPRQPKPCSPSSSPGRPLPRMPNSSRADAHRDGAHEPR